MSPSYVRLAYFTCAASFLAILVIFLRIDLNGMLFGMSTWVTLIAGVVSAIAGLWANLVLFRYKRRERFIATVLGLFCLYCLVEMCHLWLRQF
jgi:hypothetical protein